MNRWTVSLLEKSSFLRMPTAEEDRAATITFLPDRAAIAFTASFIMVVFPEPAGPRTEVTRSFGLEQMLNDSGLLVAYAFRALPLTSIAKGRVRASSGRGELYHGFLLLEYF